VEDSPQIEYERETAAYVRCRLNRLQSSTRMPAAGPSRVEVEIEMARILASPEFVGAERPAKLLRFLVDESLEGRAAQLKESVIAVAVLGRAPGFDPKVDPIVRVEVSRLRSRMELYYGSNGRDDAVRINLPKGSYSPLFEYRERPVGGARVRTFRPSVRLLGGCALLAVMGTAILWLRPGVVAIDQARVKLAMAAPEGTTLHSIAMSPDGAAVAIAAYKDGVSRLYVRRLDSFDATAVPGSESASYPFWSPDSRAIGFFANGRLQVIDRSGGPAKILCDAPIGRGATWSAAGEIVFAPTVSGPLYRVPSSGGKPAPATVLDRSRSDIAHMWPQFLPDGRGFLYYAISSDASMSGIDVTDAPSGASRRVVAAGSGGALAGRSPMYLLFERNGALTAQRFDPARALGSGDPFPITPHLRIEPLSRYAFLSTSRTGTVAFVPGSPFDQELVWLHPNGSAPVRAGGPAGIISVRISPNGDLALVNRNDEQTGRPGIWVLDLARGSMRPFSRQYIDWLPVWSADGTQAAFSRIRGSAPNMDLVKAAIAGGEPVVLHAFDHAVFPTDWSSDGASIAYTGYTGSFGRAWILPLGGANHSPYAVSEPGHNSGGAIFYPDPEGRSPAWIAYTSDESGRNEVYVQSFSKAGRKIQISTDGGDRPLWRADGKVLFFVDAKGRLMHVAVVDPGPMKTGAPTPLLTLPPPNPTAPPFALSYAPSPDGSRFLVRRRIEPAGSESISIMTNWKP
jgi:eukaryotic-like serine/threonine-protein kinase